MGRRTGWRPVIGVLLLAAELSALGAAVAHARESAPSPVHFEAASHPGAHDHTACPAFRAGALDNPPLAADVPLARPAERLLGTPMAATALPAGAPSTLADARAPPCP